MINELNGIVHIYLLLLLLDISINQSNPHDREDMDILEKYVETSNEIDCKILLTWKCAHFLENSDWYNFAL